MNNCKKLHHCCVDKGSPYLQITLNEKDSKPKVIFKGKEFEMIDDIYFHFEIDAKESNVEDYPGMTVRVNYFERDKNNDFVTSKKIEERIKGHLPKN